MYAAHLSFSNNRPAKSALTDAKSARLAAAALLFCNIYVLLRALRHAFFDRSAGRRGGKASEHRLAELHRHAPHAGVRLCHGQRLHDHLIQKFSSDALSAPRVKPHFQPVAADQSAHAALRAGVGVCRVLNGLPCREHLRH